MSLAVAGPLLVHVVPAQARPKQPQLNGHSAQAGEGSRAVQPRQTEQRPRAWVRPHASVVLGQMVVARHSVAPAAPGRCSQLVLGKHQQAVPETKSKDTFELLLRNSLYNKILIGKRD